MFFHSCSLLAFYEVDKYVGDKQLMPLLLMLSVLERVVIQAVQIRFFTIPPCAIRSYLNAILCLINNKLLFIYRD